MRISPCVLALITKPETARHFLKGHSQAVCVDTMYQSVSRLGHTERVPETPCASARFTHTTLERKLTKTSAEERVRLKPARPTYVPPNVATVTEKHVASTVAAFTALTLGVIIVLTIVFIFR